MVFVPKLGVASVYLSRSRRSKTRLAECQGWQGYECLKRHSSSASFQRSLRTPVEETACRGRGQPSVKGTGPKGKSVCVRVCVCACVRACVCVCVNSNITVLHFSLFPNGSKDKLVFKPGTLVQMASTVSTAY